MHYTLGIHFYYSYNWKYFPRQLLGILIKLLKLYIYGLKIKSDAKKSRLWALLAIIAYLRPILLLELVYDLFL